MSKTSITLATLLVICLIGTGWLFMRNNELKTQKLSLESQATTFQANLDKAELELSNLHKQYTTLKQNYNNTLTEKEQLAKEKQELKQNLDSTTQQLWTTQSELTTLRSKYPLRNFTSRSELANWVAQHTGVHRETADKYYGEALKIQHMAMLDGYKVSASISDAGNDEYIIFLMAIAGETIYWWFPDENDLYQYPINYYEFYQAGQGYRQNKRYVHG
jgi:regulator of replication initiation timing